MNKTLLPHLDPCSTLTLREAISRLRQAEGPDSDNASLVDPDLRGALLVHDAIHAVFGCPTTLPGEVLAHVWTFLGTTVDIGEMYRVNAHQNHRRAIAEIGHLWLLITWGRSLPRLASAALAARRMSSRWPANEVERFLDVPLSVIRSEFGIRLVRPLDA